MQLLLSHFSHVWLSVTPEMAAHQAPPSLGFSRQEHWSGLPFPSPMHEREKWEWSRSVMSDPQQPPWTAAHQAPPAMGYSRQEYWSGVPLPSLNYLNNLVQKCLLWLCIPGVVIKPIKTLIAVLIHERKSDLNFGGKSISFGELPKWLSDKEST